MGESWVVRIPATPAGLLEGRDALEKFCVTAQLPRDESWRLHVAFDEIVSNIVRHAAAARPVAIHAAFRHDGGTIQMDIEDDGPPFDPLAYPPPDTGTPLEDRAPGGLGIMLVRRVMDHVEYRRAGGNILRLTRRVAAAAPGV